MTFDAKALAREVWSKFGPVVLDRHAQNVIAETLTEAYEAGLATGEKVDLELIMDLRARLRHLTDIVQMTDRWLLRKADGRKVDV